MKMPNQKSNMIRVDKSNRQQGGTIMGFVLGLVVGLGIAFGITFYLNKNTPQERPGVRAPNLPLAIKPVTPAGDGESPPAETQIDLNKPLQGKTSPPSTSDPIGDLVNSKKTADTAATAKSDAIYFLQAGAFVKRADADAQKANLAIQGIQAQLSEVTSEGNTLWRVRVGPFNSIEESNPVRDKLNSVGIKPTLIKASKS